MPHVNISLWNPKPHDQYERALVRRTSNVRGDIGTRFRLRAKFAPWFLLARIYIILFFKASAKAPYNLAIFLTLF